MSRGPDAASRAELDLLMGSFLRALSFELGNTPSHDTIPALFAKAGRIADHGRAEAKDQDVREFIAVRAARVATGELTRYREHEVSEATELSGAMAHRLSVFARSSLLNGISFRSGGVLSTHFISTSSGWRISALAWEDEWPLPTGPMRPHGVAA
jgi:hypothetical protein